MRFFEKTKGAISIFLVIILVPMMTLSSAFVDAGKVRLGSALSESAGDLALNTALTYYDTDLKELYGLMATAQDTSDLFMKLEDYYTKCLISTGLNADETQYYVEQIMTSLGAVAESNDTADIVNMQVVDFSVNKVSDANLANAAIMKRQIVDFMKYRAPINTGLSFISSLKSFSTLSKQTKLVEKKQEYYKQQQTVLEDLKSAWSHIAAYNKTKVASETGYIETMNNNMKVFVDGGKIGNTTYVGYNQIKDSDRPVGLTYLTVWDLYDSEWALDYSYAVEAKDVNYNSPYGEATEENYPKMLMGLAPEDTFSKYCDNYYNKKNKAEAMPSVGDFKTQLSNFYALYSDVEEEYAGIANRMDFDANSEHILRFHVNAMRSNNYGSGVDYYSSKVASLYLSYQNIKAMEIWVENYDVLNENADEESSGITSKEVLDTVISLKAESHQTDKMMIRKWCDDAETKFTTHMQKFSIIADRFSDYNARAKTEYDKSMNKAAAELPLISSQVTEYKKQLTTAESNLTLAIQYLEAAKTKLSGTVAEAKREWNSAATDGDINETSLAKQDKAEIDQLDKYLNEDNINKLVKRLTNVRDDVKATLTELEKYQFGGKFLGDINSATVMIDAFGAKKGTFLDLSAKKGELNGFTGNWIVQNFSKGNISYSWVTQQSHQPNLNLDKTSLYSYLVSHFANVTAAGEVDTAAEKTEDKENGQELYDNIKGVSKETANNKGGSLGNTSDGEEGSKDEGDSDKDQIKDMADLPSKDEDVPAGKETPAMSKVDTDVDSGAGSAASGLDGMFGDGFFEAVADFGTDLRDWLYVSDYIMSMFSYDTIEKEYIQEQKEKGNSISKVAAGDLETLTRCDISPANNYAYGNEVEYIIYGGSYEGNKAKAYASIFGIRFGFNVVYAFATSEIRDSALAIATPISAATLGIVPVPLIQAAIIIGIACCESAIDLDALSNGHKVPLYKTRETWRCSISGLTESAKNKVKEIAADAIKDVSEAVVDESVNQLNEYLNMASDELDELLATGEEKASDAIIGVFDDVVTENAEAAIQQLTTYINTAVESTLCLDEGETFEGKKADMIKWVKEEITAWGNQFTGTDLVSTVKRETAKVIVNNSDMCINALFDKVYASMKITNPEDSINSIIADKATENSIDKLGGTVMKHIESIRSEIQEEVVNASSELKEYKNKLKNEIDASIANGAEDFKNTINNHVDGIFGTGSKAIGLEGSNTTGAAAFFSFSYSDYLRLFLLIGIVANEEKVLLRTADVIQVNMAKCIAKDKDYKLSYAAAYVEINAEVQVKPTLLALPLFADVSGNPITKTNWYTLKYHGVAGY